MFAEAEHLMLQVGLNAPVVEFCQEGSSRNDLPSSGLEGAGL